MKINVVIIVPKAEELIEISSRKIAIKQKELNRKLTNDEKTKYIMRYKIINKNNRLQFMSRSMIFYIIGKFYL